MPRFDPQELAAWCRGTWRGSPDGAVEQVVHDTRTLLASSLYIALRGNRCDGHTFVADAFAAGAAAALVDESFLPHAPADLPLLVVEDTRRALGALATGHRRKVGATVMGITGSAGKTTVKDMLTAMVRSAGPTASTLGNWNNDIGLPLSLLAMESDTRYGVFEVGTNSPGEIRALTALLEPDHGILTGIGAAHLEALESEALVAQEKADLFAALPASGWAVMVRDEVFGAAVRERTSCQWLTVADSGEADWVGQTDPADRSVLRVEERASGESVRLTLPIPGAFFRRDVLLAVAAARQCDVAWEAIRDAVVRFKPPEMRWSRQQVGGVTLVNDAYNANPLSMRASLDAFKELQGVNARWLVLGGMHELGAGEQEAHRDVGAGLAEGSWEGLLTLGEKGKWLADGATGAGLASDKVFACGEVAELTTILADRVKPGDAILFKASRGEALERVVHLLVERWDPDSVGLREES